METEAPYGVSYMADKPIETPEHYKMAIEPLEFALKNGLGICEFNILKYLCRFKRKDGKKDLLKARHYLDLLIQHEYPD